MICMVCILQTQICKDTETSTEHVEVKQQPTTVCFVCVRVYIYLQKETERQSMHTGDTS